MNLSYVSYFHSNLVAVEGSETFRVKLGFFIRSRFLCMSLWDGQFSELIGIGCSVVLFVFCF